MPTETLNRDTQTEPALPDSNTELAGEATLAQFNLLLFEARSRLWSGHYDSSISFSGPGQELSYRTSTDADILVGGLELVRSNTDTLRGTRFERPLDPEGLLYRVVDVAEYIRRSLSHDVYSVSDSIPSNDENFEDISEAFREYHRTQTRAEQKTKLQGFDSSIAHDRIRKAEISGDYHDLAPLNSVRKYEPIESSDILAFGEEDPATFASLVADALSPLRNEHNILSEEVVQSIATAIQSRGSELGNLSEVLLLNAWRIAVQNSYENCAKSILSMIKEGSALREYLEGYEQKTSIAPTEELLQENLEQYRNEFIEAGGNPDSLNDGSSEKPSVRIRLKPIALWSAAMRDDGMIRTGDEGMQRKSRAPKGRGEDMTYAQQRKRVEQLLFGDAGIDTVVDEPIIYGYFVGATTELTSNIQSAMSTIYGPIELVFKPDLAVETRAIYGDSLNAISVEARREENGRISTEAMQEVLNKRLVPQDDAGEIADIITFLHGQDPNTEFNISANPYIESVMRGRISLYDCKEIRIDSSVWDTFPPRVLEEIKERYGVEIIKAGERQN